jgi:pyruvate/2-oxoglutarate dehydrogenase complex dihydrolipoamide acyltransferase (E2) component
MAGPYLTLVHRDGRRVEMPASAAGTYLDSKWGCEFASEDDKSLYEGWLSGADDAAGDGAGEEAGNGEAEAPAADSVQASDAARALAEEHGIDLATVEGTGSGGNITKGDIQRLIG